MTSEASDHSVGNEKHLLVGAAGKADPALFAHARVGAVASAQVFEARGFFASCRSEPRQNGIVSLLEVEQFAIALDQHASRFELLF